jgi:hypothetical protein
MIEKYHMIQKIAVLFSKKEGYCTLFISPQAFLSPFVFQPDEIDISGFEKLAVIDVYEEDTKNPSERIMYCFTDTPFPAFVNNTQRLRHPADYLLKDIPLEEMSAAEKVIFQRVFVDNQRPITGWVRVSKRRGRLIEENITTCTTRDLVL